MANINETTPAAPQTFEVKSDATGNWQLEVSNKIAPGPHIVTVEDEYGNQSQVMMYVIGENTATPAKPEVIERITTAMPPFFSYLMLIMFGIIIVLSFNLMRLARKADHHADGTQSRKYTKRAIIFSAIVLVLAFATGLLLNRETNFLSRFFAKNYALQSVKVTGQLINPITLEGVSDIDLVSGNTSIKTSASGYFVFENVLPAKGIRATSPDLLRALVFLPTGRGAEETMNIQFDAEMYNLLVRVMDLESRGNFEQAYNFLAPEVRQKIAPADYAKAATTIFGPRNISDQELIITQTRVSDQWVAKKYDLAFTKVAEISVSANGQADQYYLVKGEAGWGMVK